MIAAYLLYVFAVSLLLALAALAGEQIADLFDLPKRFVWIGAMGLTLVLTTGRPFTSRSALSTQVRDTVRSTASALPTSVRNSARRATTEVADLLVIENSPSSRVRAVISGLRALNNALVSTLRPYDPLLAAVWLVLSSFGFALLVTSLLNIRRGQRRWLPHVIARTRVMLTHDLGPAVVGFWRYEIVVPTWLLELPPEQQRLVVTHEREHVNAHDPRVLLGAFVFAALMPWNAPLLFMLRRLREAIELDCDARVLEGQGAEPSLYGTLLLDVSERSFEANVPIAALAEPAGFLGRRIEALCQAAPHHAVLRTLGLFVVATMTGILACVIPTPTIQPTTAAAARDSVRVATVPATPQRQRDSDVVRIQRQTNVGSRERSASAEATRAARPYPAPGFPAADRDTVRRFVLAQERERHPGAFVAHGDSATFIAAIVDTVGRVLQDTIMVLPSRIRILNAGRLGVGSLEVESRPGSIYFTFAQLFPNAPPGHMVLGGLSPLWQAPEPQVEGSMAYEILATGPAKP